MPSEQRLSPDLIEGALQLSAALRQARLKYALIGGLAAGYRTLPRFTRDVDYLLQIPQLTLPALLDDLQTRGFTLEPLEIIQQWTQQHITAFAFRGVRIDWLKPVIPAYQHVLDQATEETWLNQPIRIASIEGLILTKLMSFRSQDVTDIENLVAASGNALDLAWIQSEWQTIANLDDPPMLKLVELVQAARTATP